jgi:tRNA(Ile)-lysidine synthase
MSSFFAEAVLETIEREELLRPGEHVLVGLSGGADSVALLSVLAELRGSLAFELTAAHLDHALRPESGADAAFATDLATRLQIPFRTERIHWHAHGGLPEANLEARAREIRYEFLRRCARDVGAAQGCRGIIAVGHHADDRLETLLVQLIRGAGPRGLSQPRYRREDGIVRPLLDRTRAEILAYLKECGLPHREDPTNDDGSNLRSRIRRDIVPLLTRENPDIARTVGRTARLLADFDEGLTDLARGALAEWTIEESAREIALDAPRGRPYHPFILSMLLREALQRVRGDLSDIGYDPIAQSVRALREGSKSVIDLPGAVRVTVNGDRVRVTRTDAPPTAIRNVELPVPGRIVWADPSPGFNDLPTHLRSELVVPPPARPEELSGDAVAWLDADRIVYPLRVRARRAGDRYRPLGLGGSAKLQDLLVDRKVRRERRDALPVVVDREGILWVPGLRIADRVRISGKTRRALRVEAIGPAPSIEESR